MQHFTPTSVPSLSALALALAVSSGCTFDTQFCVADCPGASGGANTDASTGDGGSTTDAPTDPTSAGPTTDGSTTADTDAPPDGPPSTCELEDTVPDSTTCMNFVVELGELCYDGGASGSQYPAGVVSVLPVLLDDDGDDVLISLADGTVGGRRFPTNLEGFSSASVAWDKTFTAPLILADRGDFDSDGFNDVVARTEGAPDTVVLVTLGLGGQPVSDAVVFSTADILSAHTIDYDGDGDLDILVFTSAESELENMLVLLGDGAGGFTVEGLATAPSTAVHAVGQLNGVDTEDILSGDQGVFEVVYDDFKGNVYVHIEPTMVPLDLEIGDLDGIGGDDFVALVHDAATDLPALVVALQAPNANPEVPTFTVSYYAVGCDADAVALGDLDGDGRLDVVIGGSGGSVALKINNGLGDLLAPTKVVSTGGELGDIAAQLFVVDLNSDGANDIVISSPDANAVSFLAAEP